jgi:cephalosporin hydroxylase
MTIPILNYLWKLEMYLFGLVSPSTFDKYHLWYYNTGLFQKTSFLGVHCIKFVTDAWNYQEIISELKPSLIIEVGSANGGSALFFSTILKAVSPHSKVISIDIDGRGIVESARENRHIVFIRGTLPTVVSNVIAFKREYPGPIFAILDSDHSKQNVLKEMLTIRDNNLLSSGDYLIIEDSNVNGHPVFPTHGDGPYEAIEDYFRLFPDDYTHDTAREHKFGFTAAPNGFLVKR